jgi:SAM-dependent methyltransferase
MHKTATLNLQMFFEIYRNNFTANLLEVGSKIHDDSDCLRDFLFLDGSIKYIGIDTEPGKGVDLVTEDPYKLPVEDSSQDMVITSSTFEHADFFWLLIEESMRVLKPHGLLYVNAPSQGEFHRYPIDSWRFYPDAGRYMAKWARRCGYANCTLLESYISLAHPDDGESKWNDNVVVLLKDSQHKDQYPRRILRHFESFYNGCIDDGDVMNRSKYGEIHKY